MDKVLEKCFSLLNKKDFDALGVGVLDFKKKGYSFFQIDKEKRIDSEKIYYDLASVSKPLINSSLYFSGKIKISKDMELLINHEGGLPSWGLLSKETYKEELRSYQILKSETLYSDYSAMRFFLETDERIDVAREIWDQETLYWLELNEKHKTLPYGGRKLREVHDPNAFNLKSIVSHAGVFSTLEGLLKTLLSFNEKYDLLKKMKGMLQENKSRFTAGFDRPTSLDTLAGSLAFGKNAFGHLGFTGTSFWIDAEEQIGHVILTNATKHFYYDKKELNEIRREIGDLVWQRKIFF